LGKKLGGYGAQYKLKIARGGKSGAIKETPEEKNSSEKRNRILVAWRSWQVPDGEGGLREKPYSLNRREGGGTDFF